MNLKLQSLVRPYMGLPKEVYVIFIARIINAMGLVVFPLITLILTRIIGLSGQQAGFIVAISGLMFIPSSFIGGKLADTIGRKKVIIIFDTLAVIVYISCIFVETSMLLVYLIILAGFCMGVGDPAHNSLIADLTTPKNRDGAYSLSYLGFNLGFIIAPTLGAFLLEKNLQLMFLIDAVTALIAIGLIFIFINETFETTKEDLGEDRKHERRETGSIFKVLLSRRILLYFSLIIFGYNFVYSQWFFMLPMHISENFGPVLYGMLGSFNAIIVIIFTPLLTSFFSNRKNIRKIIYGGVLYTLGFGMLGFIDFKIAFFASVLIFTLGEILVTISCMPFIANHTPASHRGRMSSVISILMGAGFSLGPLVMGTVLEYVTISFAWKIIGCIMLISTLLMIVLEKYELNSKKLDIDRQETSSEITL